MQTAPSKRTGWSFLTADPQVRAAVVKWETYLQVWDAELVVDGEVVGSCGGCHHFVPRLLAGLLPRSRNQPKLCHVCRGGVARKYLKEA